MTAGVTTTAPPVVGGTPTRVDLEANKSVARRLYEEVITEGRLDLLDELLAADATRATPAGPADRASFAQHVVDLRANITDLRATVTDLVAEGDRVVVFWRIQGVHAGTLWGVPASGNAIDGNSISLITFRQGRIADYAVTPDRLTILRQLGALPS